MLLCVVAMAPLRWTIPEMVRTAAPDVPKGALVQAFWRVSGVNELADVANEAPSSEVKHWALADFPPSASMVTTPVGRMNRRPLVALHRSTGTYTFAAGRKPAGRVNGEPAPCAVAPLKWTVPVMVRTAALGGPEWASVPPSLRMDG